MDDNNLDINNNAEDSNENNIENREINSIENSDVIDFVDEDKTEIENSSDENQDNKNQNNGKKKSLGREILGWVLTILIAFFIASLIRAFVFDHAVVDGTSMNNTLQNKEHLIIYKFGYLFSPPHRGDIIMFEYKKGLFKYLPFPDPQEIDYIKRVIAVPGDKVDLINGSVYLNGKRSIEKYAVGRTEEKVLKFPLVVPPNKVLALGDNREFSSDSREIGLIGFDRIKGKAILSIFPFDKIGII